MATRKATTPEQLTKASAMREAGYTLLAISQQVGLSVRTLQRQLGAQGVTKGRIKEELVQAARAELMNRITEDEAIRTEVARLVADDLAHTRHLRELMLQASTHLVAHSLQDAALVMRAAAAYSTALKNTSDTLRHTLRPERALEEDPTAIPELVIRELTIEEVQELRAQVARNPTEELADDVMSKSCA